MLATPLFVEIPNIVSSVVKNYVVQCLNMICEVKLGACQEQGAAQHVEQESYLLCTG